MRSCSTLVKGTLILTATGIVSRLIGFFYRIFLAGQLGGEGMGIYQLIFPIYAICHSIGISGIQTALSKLCAEHTAKNDYRGARQLLFIGLALAVGISILIGLCVINLSDFYSIHVLQEPRCSKLLRILALALPFSAIHSCINGYYYALKKTAIPSISQLLEQCTRVASVMILFSISETVSVESMTAVAAIGLVIGECAATLLSVTAYLWCHEENRTDGSLHHGVRQILLLSIPLAANRGVLNIIQNVETILIPSRLKDFGLSNSESLSVYGTLTGMAMPFILFPNTLFNSIAVLLLPSIAEAQAQADYALIYRYTKKNTLACIGLGVLSTLCFLLFGPFIGNLVFHSELAGSFLITLAWICPFLYLTTTLGSILNGLGKIHVTFCHNVAGLAIRIIFVLMAIPTYGIKGYLWGLLVSELTITVLHMDSIQRFLKSPSQD